jgi:uncharacterized protein
LSLYYLDTSALMKLVTEEAESKDFAAWFGKQSRKVRLVSCDLARTELMRATRRLPLAYVSRVRDVLDTLFLVTVPTSTYEAAALLDPPALRSLDAIHLAAAIAFGDELRAFVTYDDQLSIAALQNGLHVLAPGKPSTIAAR